MTSIVAIANKECKNIKFAYDSSCSLDDGNFINSALKKVFTIKNITLAIAGDVKVNNELQTYLVRNKSKDIDDAEEFVNKELIPVIISILDSPSKLSNKEDNPEFTILVGIKHRLFLISEDMSYLPIPDMEHVCIGTGSKYMYSSIASIKQMVDTNVIACDIDSDILLTSIMQSAFTYDRYTNGIITIVN